MRRGWSRVPIRLAPNGERENRQMKNSAIGEHDQREIVEARARRGCRSRTASAAPAWRMPLSPPVSVVGAIGDAPDDLAERQRDHDEAQARRAQRQHAEQAGARRSRTATARIAAQQLIVARDGEQDAGVAGDAEIGGVAERHHAAVAEHHVDADSANSA